jgi:hypothetical protein
MNDPHGKRTMSRYPWPCIGVLLVALILGHDGLMAAAAVAAPRHAREAQEHARPRTIERLTLSLNDSGPASDHSETCRIGLSAVPRTTNDDVGADRERTAIAALMVPGLHSKSDVAFSRAEPRWPPGTLRAFFQVYRL